MKLDKLKKLIKEELQKLIVENVVCDTRNNNPYTGVSSTCPAVPGQGSQTCNANFPPGPTGFEGTCGPSGMTTGGTPTRGNDREPFLDLDSISKQDDFFTNNILKNYYSNLKRTKRN